LKKHRVSGLLSHILCIYLLATLTVTAAWMFIEFLKIFSWVFLKGCDHTISGEPLSPLLRSLLLAGWIPFAGIFVLFVFTLRRLASENGIPRIESRPADPAGSMAVLAEIPENDPGRSPLR
jgi:Trk-type K+ transport system membrane component